MNDLSIWQYIVPTNILGNSNANLIQAIDWCQEHLDEKNWELTWSYFYFRYEQDAFWFHLVWGDDEQ